MNNFGKNLGEFITDFKERVVEHAYWHYPKEYRKSDEYSDQDLNEKFEEALSSDWGRTAIIDTIEAYYNTIHEYEEDLGY